MINIPIQPPTSVKDCYAIICTDFLVRFENEFKDLKYSDVDKKVKEYLIIKHKDIFPRFVEIVRNEQAIDPIRKHLNNYLSKLFMEKYTNGVIILFQPNSPSMATVFENDSQRSRRYEFEVIHVPDMEVLLAFTYSQGEITLMSGKLPLTEISAVLQEIRAWEM